MPVERTAMIDISDKPDVRRSCIAEGTLHLKKETIELLKKGKIEKGDSFVLAQAAALLAIKNTPLVIPHCHPIPITKASVEFSYLPQGIKVEVLVKNIAKTGVEIEALHAASIALLTIWDTVKKYEKDETGQYPSTKITDLRILKKQKKVLE
jgi:cyclic pyranopterin phosphate synthase